MNTNKDFEVQTLRAFKNYEGELDAMEKAISNSVKKKTKIPNLKDIYKEIADVAADCKQTLEFYGDEDPLPAEIRRAMERVMEQLNTCCSALVLHESMKHP